MANPVARKIVHNNKDRNDYIKEYMSFRPIYMSLYSFSRIMPTLQATHPYAIVDKLFFDIDPDENEDTYSTMINLHNYFLKMDVIHRIHLSGRGFHFFVWIMRNLKYPKLTIANYWDYLTGDKNGCWENPFTKGQLYESPGFPLCPSTRGDLGRIFRYPNTYNWKTKCYCIVLDDKLLKRCNSLKSFQEVAQKPYNPQGKIYFGKKLLDISDFDCDDETYEHLGITSLKLNAINYSKIDINYNVDFKIEDTPYCIQELIKHELHFNERNMIIKFLVNRADIEFPYNDRDIMGCLFKISHNNEWLRWLFTNNIELLYRNVRVVYDNENIIATCNQIRKLESKDIKLCDSIKCGWKDIMNK